MIIKLFGIILIIFSCSSIGFIEKYKYTMRIKELDNFAKCMNVFMVEICYSYENINDALNKILLYATDINRNIFQKIAKNYSKSDGTPISEIWSKEFNNINSGIYGKEEIDIFKNFGNLLGSGNAEIQEANIEELKKQLNLLLEKLKKDEDKISAFSKIGIYAGIIIVILLI